MSCKVTRDCSVDGSTRNKRKAGLKILGEEYCRRGLMAGGSVDQIMQKMMDQAGAGAGADDPSAAPGSGSSSSGDAAANPTPTPSGPKAVYAREVPNPNPTPNPDLNPQKGVSAAETLD